MKTPRTTGTKFQVYETHERLPSCECPHCGEKFYRTSQKFLTDYRQRVMDGGGSTICPTLLFATTYTEWWEREGATCSKCRRALPWATVKRERGGGNAFDAECSRRAEAIIKAEDAGDPIPKFLDMRLGDYEQAATVQAPMKGATP